MIFDLRKKTGGKTREAATSRRQQRRISKVLQESKNAGKTASKEVLLQSNATSLEVTTFIDVS